MHSGEDYQRVDIPFFLRISWVWLFLAEICEGGLRAYFKFNSWHSLDVLLIWSFLQAAWLMRVDQRSTAIFWYAADFLLYRAGLAHWMRTQHAAVSHALIIAAAILSWVSILHLRRDMKRYFLSTDGVELYLTIPQTFLFSTLYFQSRFHEIAELRRADSLRVSPSAT